MQGSPEPLKRKQDYYDLADCEWTEPMVINLCGTHRGWIVDETQEQAAFGVAPREPGCMLTLGAGHWFLTVIFGQSLLCSRSVTHL